MIPGSTRSPAGVDDLFTLQSTRSADGCDALSVDANVHRPGFQVRCEKGSSDDDALLLAH